MDLNKLKDKRVFDFVITVPDVVDGDNERFDASDLDEAMDLWLINNAPISLNHSNQIVGKGVRWWKDNYKGYDAYFARGIINDGPLGDDVWDKINSGVYKDVSFGGYSLSPVTNSDGSVELKDSYLLEVAVCEDGVHPLSDIVDVNSVAKSGKWVAKARIVSRKEDYTDFVNQNKVSDSACVELDNNGGVFMKKMQDKVDETSEAVEVKEVDSVSVEEFNSLKEQVAQIAEYISGLVDTEKSVAGTGEAGGEVTADNVEDDAEQFDGAGDEEKDEAGIDEEGLENKPITDNTTLTKMIREEVAKAVKKTVAVAKAKSPRPVSSVEEKEFDAYNDVLKAKGSFDFSTLRNKSRENYVKELSNVLGRKL